MKFNWLDYIIVAKDLLNFNKSKASEEALSRASISRVYYGCHCSVRNYLLSKGYDLYSNNNDESFATIHTKVITSIKEEKSDKIHWEIGENLNRLRGIRIKADYYDSADIDKNKAVFCLKRAELILDNLKSLT